MLHIPQHSLYSVAMAAITITITYSFQCHDLHCFGKPVMACNMDSYMRVH